MWLEFEAGISVPWTATHMGVSGWLVAGAAADFFLVPQTVLCSHQPVVKVMSSEFQLQICSIWMLAC